MGRGGYELPVGWYNPNFVGDAPQGWTVSGWRRGLLFPLDMKGLSHFAVG